MVGQDLPAGGNCFLRHEIGPELNAPPPGVRTGRLCSNELKKQSLNVQQVAVDVFGIAEGMHVA